MAIIHRKEKEFAKTPSAPLAALIDEVQMSKSAIAEVIGVSHAAVSTWLSTGQMPAYMTHVCAALSRRDTAPQKAAIIVAGDADRVMTVKRLTEDLKLEVVLLDVLKRR